jgi:hypothetical protein
MKSYLGVKQFGLHLGVVEEEAVEGSVHPIIHIVHEHGLQVPAALTLCKHQDFTEILPLIAIPARLFSSTDSEHIGLHYIRSKSIDQVSHQKDNPVEIYN